MRTSTSSSPTSSCRRVVSVAIPIVSTVKACALVTWSSPCPCASQEERISATKARKAGEIALKAAEQVREKAQGSAQQLKEGSEQRLVKQLAAQRYVSP